MTTAFEKPLKGQGLRALVLAAANQHLAAGAFELTIKNESNSGPWVRAYMDGNEGRAMVLVHGFCAIHELTRQHHPWAKIFVH
jgi:hypothetical protein